jgi:hypothetical protein
MQEQAAALAQAVAVFKLSMVDQARMAVPAAAPRREPPKVAAAPGKPLAAPVSRSKEMAVRSESKPVTRPVNPVPTPGGDDWEEF